MKYEYYAISCNCSIELRKCTDTKRYILTKTTCPRCNGMVIVNYYKNIATPGYSDYEDDDYLLEE